MTLEQWDPCKRKHVLYQSTGQFSDDCMRFPFEGIPKRVFLDTNVINVLVKHRAHVFDHEPIPMENVAFSIMRRSSEIPVSHKGSPCRTPHNKRWIVVGIPVPARNSAMSGRPRDFCAAAIQSWA
jgi:hypothetical protein